MLIKRYLAYFQCGAHNFGYVFEQHPVSQDSHIDGFHSTQRTQSCSPGSELFQCSYWPPAMDRLLWLSVCTGFSSISYWSPATDQQFWLWVCLGFSNVSYWSPQDLQFWFWVCVTDSYHRVNQQGMNSNFTTTEQA